MIVSNQEPVLHTSNYIIVYPIVSTLRNIDLTKFGLEIFRIDSEQFIEIYDDELRACIPILQTITALHLDEYCYVIAEHGDTKNLWKFFYFLRTSMPSAVVNPISHFEMSFQINGGSMKKFNISSMSGWEVDIHKSIEKPFSLTDLKKFEYLLGLFISRYSDNDFQKLLGVYLAATNNTDSNLKFLILMMLVESLITDNENTGVTYKICRTCAILLGNDMTSSETIFENMKILYDDRSKFVHNANVEHLSDEKVDYLHHLVCSVMTTFVLGEIKLKTLFKNANKYGYGQRLNLLGEYGITNDINFTVNSAHLLKIVKKK